MDKHIASFHISASEREIWVFAQYSFGTDDYRVSISDLSISQSFDRPILT